MKKHIRLWFALPALGGLLAPCAPGLEYKNNTVLPAATSSAVHGRLAGNIHAQVNAYRQSLGKPALQRHAGLDRLAQQHAEFMLRNRGKFGDKSTHYGFEERTLMAQRGMGISDVGENVGTCRGAARPADMLVEAWKKSKGHQMNLKGGWTQTGIGVAVDNDGAVFATQLFGNVDHSHLSLTNRMRSF
ncbi:CAP domain-containing protein [Luteolibacter soli]|uniref:CAP domain-containing protein n=1 Tax=Luteolibacter soli TaxID=3135280 RepID=A0ABU9AWY2_9BACT